jgi:cytochrome c biogenesis factor
VAIRSDYLTGEDLFLNADDLRKDGSVQLEASVKPLVNLIWLAGLVFLFGSVVAMWPDAREERRLATRYAENTGLARA